jgi:hypothetical protein
MPVHALPTRWRRHAAAIAAAVLAIATAAVSAAAEARSTAIEVTLGPPPLARVEHVFGGRPFAVPIVLHGAPGGAVDLQGRWFLRAPALAAPVGDFIAIASGARMRTSRLELSVEMTVPAVERESTLELIVFLRPHGGDAWRRAGSLSVRVYPRDLLEPLRRLSERQPLRVRDGAGAFARFLQAQGVAFVDLNARVLEPLDSPALTLLAGGADDLTLAKERARRGEAVIVFREREVGFPRIELARWGLGSVTIVQLPVGDRLLVDPQAQKDFLEMLVLARSYGRAGEEGGHEDHDRR